MFGQALPRYAANANSAAAHTKYHPRWRPKNVSPRTIGRLALIVCCVAIVATSAWWTRSAAMATSTAPTPSIDVDALMVGVEEVRRIANFDGLRPQTHADLHQPSQGNVNAPGLCRAVGNSDLTFGSGWTQFRGVAHSGATDSLVPGGATPFTEVSQAVAVYPDAGTARAALARLTSSLTECASWHDEIYDFAVHRPDDSTLQLRSAGWSHVYRVKSSVLMSIGVSGLEPTEQIATTVLDTITGRVS